MARTLLVHSPRSLDHAPEAVPDRPDRLRRTIERLRAAALDAEWLEAVPAPLPLLHRAHAAEYVAKIRAYGAGEPVDYKVVNADTTITEATYEAALLAAGGAAGAVDAVLDGRATNAMVLSRPGGHHAEPDRGTGFCVFNTIAVAAHRARERGLERVAIVDWDVHHGNGTQKIFWKDPSVLFISLHQDGLFPPGSGGEHEVGYGPATGTKRNFPLPAGTVTGTYLRVFRQEVLPILERFRPELLLIDCGFDAHHQDPLGGLRLSDEAFDVLTRIVTDFSGGRLVSNLAGGYNLETLPGLVERHVRGLTGK